MVTRTQLRGRKLHRVVGAIALLRPVPDIQELTTLRAKGKVAFADGGGDGGATDGTARLRHNRSLAWLFEPADAVCAEKEIVRGPAERE